jgi:hypothetical protein
MTQLFRLAAALTLAATLTAPAAAQSRSCDSTLTVEGVPICMNFSVLPGTANSNTVSVHETLAAGNKLVEKNVVFDILAGATQSRAIDDIDISQIVPGKTLHNTLLYTNATGAITLERSLLLPGAIPLK